MLKALKTLFDSFSAPAETERYADTDPRVATAALLVHLTSVDGQVAASERALLADLLAREYALDTADADGLIARAHERDVESVDLYSFTSVLKRSLDETGRQRVIEMMWEMVFIDTEVSEFEENLIWRVAELLGVETRDRIRLRKQVEAAREGSA